MDAGSKTRLTQTQDYGGLTACQGQYENCISGIIAATNVNNFDYGAVSSCYCNFGIDYLSCYSSFIYTQSCYTGLASYYDTSMSAFESVRPAPLTRSRLVEQLLLGLVSRLLRNRTAHDTAG